MGWCKNYNQRRDARDQPAYLFPRLRTALPRWAGGKFLLTQQLELFAESQWFADDTWWDGVTVFPDGFWLAGCSRIQGVGLARAELGVRFLIPK